MNVGLNQLLVASAALFAVGAFALVARRSAIVMLLGTQFMFAAGAIAFVAFGPFGLGARAFGAGAAGALVARPTAVAGAAGGPTLGAPVYREQRRFPVCAGP